MQHYTKVMTYNPIAYERIFDTIGAKFWDRIMPAEIKYDFMLCMTRWKNPSFDYHLASHNARALMQYHFNEFDDFTLMDIRTYMKIYAHTIKFERWASGLQWQKITV